MKYSVLLLLISVFAGTVPAFATTVRVRVLGVANANGTVRAEICTKSEFLKKCAVTGKAPAKRGEVDVLFHDVPAGRMAVLAYHDENNNGRLDSNLLGIPTEGTAFSRDAKGRFGPPSFESSAVKIGSARTVVPLHLNY